MTVVTTLCLVVLAVAAVVVVAVVARQRPLAERSVGLDLALAIVVNVLIVVAVRWGDGAVLDLVLLIGLLGFVSGLTVARFVERRGP